VREYLSVWLGNKGIKWVIVGANRVSVSHA
jgi:hypothetical protein